MNYKRRLLALGLIASMSLTGFRFSDDNLNQFMENMEQVSSAQGELNFQTDFRIQENGSWTEADVNVSGDWELISEPFALHVEAEVSSAAAGEVSELELYCKQRGDDLDIYFGVDGDWKYTETDYEEELQEELQEDGDLGKIYSFFEENTEMYESGEVYVYDTAISGNELLNLLGTLDETDTEDLAAAGMVLSMISVQASLEVGKADKRLQSFSLDAADSLNSVIGLLGAFSEGAFDAEVESCLFSLNVNSYNDVSDIQVPQEAFAAERFDTDNVFALVDGL